MPYVKQIREIIHGMNTERSILNEELRRLPDGNLRVCRRGDGLSYFLVDPEGRRHGIGKNKELIMDLARKEFLTAKILAAEKNSELCNSLCEKLSPDDDGVIIETLKYGLNMIPEDYFFGGRKSSVQNPKPVDDPHTPLRHIVDKLRDMTPQEWAGIRYQENTKFPEQKKTSRTERPLFQKSRRNADFIDL